MRDVNNQDVVDDQRNKEGNRNDKETRLMIEIEARREREQ